MHVIIHYPCLLYLIEPSASFNTLNSIQSSSGHSDEPIYIHNIQYAETNATQNPQDQGYNHRRRMNYSGQQLVPKQKNNYEGKSTEQGVASNTLFCALPLIIILLFWYQLLPTIVHPSSVIVPLVLRVLGCICLGILDVMDVYWFIRMTRGALYGI